MHKDAEHPLDAEEIQKKVAFFAEKKFPFIWWSNAKILEKYNFQFGGELLGIVRDLPKDPIDTTTPSQITIQPVQSADQLHQFSEIFGIAFQLVAKTSPQLHRISQAAMEAGKQIHFIAYCEEKPVGTVTLSTSPDAAGIWNLGTLPDYRKHGIGRALIKAAMAKAQELGHKHVMAILMPKGMAHGIFNKLGFQDVRPFPFYVHGIAADKDKLE